MKRFLFRTVVPLILVFASVGVYLWLSYPQEGGPGEERRTFVLDTVVRIKTFGDRNGSAAQAAFREMERIERLGDIHHSNSLAAKLNVRKKLSWSAGKDGGSTGTAGDLSDLRRILTLSQRVASETRGAFDPTVGSLVELWDIGGKNHIPDRRELEGTLSRVGYDHLDITPDGVRLGGQAEVDLGGILKGYAVDLAARTLEGQGIERALVSAVSSIRAVGERPGGGPWRVGVENPRPQDDSPFLAVLSLRDGESVSTSGDYQQYFVRGGHRYHHVLDPKTGLPAEGFLSLTVVTNRSAAEADALSTGLFVMGYPQALEWAQERDLAVLAVTSDGNVRWTKPMDAVAENILRRVDAEE